MDLRMPVIDGAGATPAIRTSQSATEVLVLTIDADDATLPPALQAGAGGFLTEDARIDEIEPASRPAAAATAICARRRTRPGETQVNRISAGTGARDRARAVRCAYRSGLTSP